MSKENLTPMTDVPVESVTSFDVTEQRRQSVTMQIIAKEGSLLSARDFAKLVTAQVKLLETIGKEQGAKIVWCMTEAAVINNRVGFTVLGLPKAEYDAMLLAAPAPSPSPAQAGAAAPAAEGRDTP